MTFGLYCVNIRRMSEIKRREIILNVHKIRYLQSLIVSLDESALAAGEYFRLMSEYHKYEWQMYRYIINNNTEFDNDQRETLESLIIEQRWDLVLKHLFMFGFEDPDVDPTDPVQIELALKPPIFLPPDNEIQ